MKRLKHFLVRLSLMLLLTAVVLYCVGTRLEFNQDFAQVLYDRDGQIINASVAQDEQWRMHCEEDMPEKLQQAVLLFEDQYFYKHPGINPVSIVKAIRDNRRAGRIVRGGSTLTMQLARIQQGNQPRNYLQKIKEIILSFAIELAYSKKEILALYGQYAPFGGNVVGYCSASWKYFEKPASQLSWSEVASIAVLPNAPGKIFPGQDQAAFLKKRDFLLRKLHRENYFDELSLHLALKESLPEKFILFRQTTPHLHEYLKDGISYNQYSSIAGDLQGSVIKVLDNYGRSYSSNGVNNLSALVVDNKSGQVISYVGNRDHSRNGANRDVDIIQALRSPGSTMKPFLYGLSFDEGLINGESLMEDVPLFINGFSPQNYDRNFSGLIKSKVALTQSLNVPAVNLLRDYGVQAFIDQLNVLGFEHTDKDDDHYGLSLILGANEVSPFELARAYTNLARRALNYKSINPCFNLAEAESLEREFPISRVHATQLINILTAVKRPRERDGWEYFKSKRQLAWKTGTSYGNRDAWAVGVTPDHTIVVWVGNASGEGRKGLTGLSKAGPILFSIVDYLPFGEWFRPVTRDYATVELCAQSGYRKGPHCTKSMMHMSAKNKGKLKACKYHRHYVLDESRNYQITSRCYEVDRGVDTSLFVLPPRVNHYLKLANGKDYSPPHSHPDCREDRAQLAIIYPPAASKVLLPREINNEQQALISKVASANPSDTLYWFVDDAFVSMTTEDHSLLIPSLSIGEHAIAVSSINGSRASSVFEVIDE